MVDLNRGPAHSVSGADLDAAPILTLMSHPL